MEIRFGRLRHVAVGSPPQRCNLAVPIKKLMVVAGLLGSGSVAAADPTVTTPDPPQRKTIPRVGPSGFSASSDLDGLYLWLGPSGAGSHVDGAWDSTFGADVSVVRVREHEAIGAIGGSFGASRWTERGGGRIWVDAMIGTRVLGRMIGMTAGPILELSELAHPKVGGSVGAWMFLGITPFARFGTVQDLGMFGEIGVHIALPVLRRR
jgi:hypothetical protein